MLDFQSLLLAADRYYGLVVLILAGLGILMLVAEFAAWRAREAVQRMLRGYVVVQTVLPARDQKTKRFVKRGK